MNAHLTAAHVGVDEAEAACMLRGAEQQGFECRWVDFGSVRSFSEYYELSGRSYEFPRPVVEENGIIDWMSDLEWLGKYPGHVAVFSGLDRLLDENPSVLRSLVSVTPRILDGMRSGGEGFHAVFVGTGSILRGIILDALKAENDWMRSAMRNYPSPNPSEPAIVVDHDK